MNKRQMAIEALERLMAYCESAGEDFGDFEVRLEFVNCDEGTGGVRTDSYRAEIVEYTNGEAHVEEYYYRRQDYDADGSEIGGERDEIKFE